MRNVAIQKSGTVVSAGERQVVKAKDQRERSKSAYKVSVKTVGETWCGVFGCGLERSKSLHSIIPRDLKPLNQEKSGNCSVSFPIV